MSGQSTVRSTRLGLLIAAAFLLACAAAYAALWKAGASAMRQTIAGAATGTGPIRVTASDFKTKGFPFFLRGDLAGVSVAAAGVDWKSDRLFVDALPINPTRFVFTPSPQQTLEIPRLGRFAITTESGRESFAPGSAGRWVADAQADSATATDSSGARVAALRGVLVKAAPEAEGTHVSLFAGTFAWTENGRSASGEKLFVDAVFRATTDGPTVAIRRLRMETSGATLESDGVLALDAEGRPSGSLQATIVNPKGLVRFLGALRALEPEKAKSAEAALSLAALASGGVLKAPVEFAGGEARIAGVTIATLPPLSETR